MSYEILIILFLILSVISSLINKLQESRRKQDQEAHRPPPGFPQKRTATSAPVEEEEEIDLSEWEVFPEVERPQPPAEEEYREVNGRRGISEEDTEEDTGEEYREVVSARPIAGAEPEFREAASTRPFYRVEMEEEALPAQKPVLKPDRKPLVREPKRRKRIRLNFSGNSLKKAVLYSEVIGQPRAARMPW